MALVLGTGVTLGQGAALMGDGLSAASIGRGDTTAVQQSSPVDAIEGNPSGLAALTAKTLDLNGIAVVALGDFRNAYNPDARIHGLAGSVPYGAYAAPLRGSHWVLAGAFTPDILMRANWRYVDAPGTAGVTYGLQQQETQIIGLRSSLGVARTLGRKWNAGVTLGVVYNQNHLAAPYIFQQQPVLEGLKVLIDLTTRGYGWNGSAGVQWQPTSSFRAGLAWKSGTTLQTQGQLNGSAAALFSALGVNAPSSFTYQAHVINHLPQAFEGGANWRTKSQTTFVVEAGMVAWGQAFQQLPLTLTGGSNPVINSIAASTTLQDAVPLHWNNQATVRVGVEYPLTESVTLRGGYSFRNNPVPSSTLTPITAAIMQHAVGTGAGWNHAQWHSDLAYQIQLPSTGYVGASALRAGEYNNSSVRVLIQSVTLSVRRAF